MLPRRGPPSIPPCAPTIIPLGRLRGLCRGTAAMTAHRVGMSPCWYRCPERSRTNSCHPLFARCILPWRIGKYMCRSCRCVVIPSFIANDLDGQIENDGTVRKQIQTVVQTNLVSHLLNAFERLVSFGASVRIASYCDRNTCPVSASRTHAAFFERPVAALLACFRALP